MWVPIADYEGLYEMDANKKVRNTKTWREMPVNCNAVTLSKKGRVKRVKVHDLQIGSLVNNTTPAPTISRTENMETNFGPWAKKNTSVLIGDAGQHLVCFELNKLGIRCATNIIEGAPYDIVADFGDGKLFTVQVKSCAFAVLQGNGVTPSYHFRFAELNFSAVDLIAFAAIDIGVVYIALAKSLRTKSIIFNAQSFTEKANITTNNTLLNFYNKKMSMSNT